MKHIIIEKNKSFGGTIAKYVPDVISKPYFATVLGITKMPNKPKIKVKAKHALGWLFGNICTRKCYEDDNKQRACYERMQAIIAGHEDFLITHKIFISVMRNKHHVCSLSAEEFYKRDPNFWRHRPHEK